MLCGSVTASPQTSVSIGQYTLTLCCALPPESCAPCLGHCPCICPVPCCSAARRTVVLPWPLYLQLCCAKLSVAQAYKSDHSIVTCHAIVPCRLCLLQVLTCLNHCPAGAPHRCALETAVQPNPGSSGQEAGQPMGCYHSWLVLPLVPCKVCQYKRAHLSLKVALHFSAQAAA